MPTILLSSNIWSRITTAAKRSKGDCAVAYLGSGASDLLPLKAGSVLVVDMSEAAVKSGQTNPAEVRKFMNRGVSVHSVHNLHAKVFVFRDKTFIGSSNVSNNSAHNLIEAAIEIASSSVISAARQFVHSLMGESITPHYLKKMAQLYRPSKFGGGEGKPVKGQRKRVAQHAPMITVQLVRTDNSAAELKAEKKGRIKAKKQLHNTKTSKVDAFFWYDRDSFKFGDILIQVVKEKAGLKMVHPPARVIHIEPVVGDADSSVVVFLEARKKLRRRNLKWVIKRLGGSAKTYLTQDRKLANPAFIHSLLQIWA